MSCKKCLVLAVALCTALTSVLVGAESAKIPVLKPSGRAKVGRAPPDRPGNELATLAFQREVSIPLGARQNTASFRVPPGKRFVIEYVSANGFVPFGQTVLFSLQTSVNGEVAAHFLVPSRFAFARVTIPDGELIRARQSMRVYADGGTEVTVNARRSGSWGGGSATVTVSGYLVHLP